MYTQIFSLVSRWEGNPLILGLVAGLIITSFNTLGSLLIFFVKKTVSQKVLDLSLGFAAGLMLAASFTSLIVPGIKIGGVLPVVIGISFGALFFDLVTNYIPHIHIFENSKKTKYTIPPLWLFIIAITIHNMPEGLSVGIAMGSHNLKEAIALMLAIGIQNTPEGFSVAVSHFAHNPTSKLKSAWIGIQSGLVEVPLTIIGILLVTKLNFLLPYAMGFGAGSMLYVISHEIIPDIHSKGYERIATIGIISGIMLMLLLDMG